MEKIVTPSITAGQIGKIQEILGAGLRKSGLPSEPVQRVIETQGDSLVAELVSTVRKHVEAVNNMIVRHVKANRTRSPREVLEATGRKQYVDNDVIKAMPKGDEDEGDVYFFKPDLSARRGHISDDDLEKEFESRGFKPADPYKLAEVNADDPSFADTHPNATHWQDENGKWCYAACLRWFDERYVYVNRDAYDWYDYWWFAGLRK